MPLDDTVRLVSIDTARAVLGITAESVIELAEDHKNEEHVPSFDLSIDGRVPSRDLDGKRRRELRFWSGALRNRTTPFAAAMDAIIADCLLTNTQGLLNQNINLNSSQLERAWCVSNQHIIRLIAALELKGVRVGRNWRVNRASAADFLRRRAC